MNGPASQFGTVLLAAWKLRESGRNICRKAAELSLWTETNVREEKLGPKGKGKAKVNGQSWATFALTSCRFSVCVPLCLSLCDIPKQMEMSKCVEMGPSEWLPVCSLAAVLSSLDAATFACLRLGLCKLRVQVNLQLFAAPLEVCPFGAVLSNESPKRVQRESNESLAKWQRNEQRLHSALKIETSSQKLPPVFFIFPAK